MRPVTDPNILAQLNGDNPTAGMQPVTDQAILAQLNSSPSPQAVPAGDINSAYMNAVPALRAINNSSPMNALRGANDAAANFGADLGNLIPGVNVQRPAPTGSGTAYEIGKFGGNVGTFIGGGAALDALRGAAVGLPVVGRAAQALGGTGLSGVARRALGSAAYGATTNPDNRAMGAVEGAALSGAADSIPGAFKLAGKAIQGIKPGQYAGELLQNLGGGKSLEANAQSIAQDIKNAYTQRMKEGGSLYQPIFNRVGASNIEAGSYKALDDDIVKNYDYDLKDLHKTFSDAPTFQNAHELRSQLGSAARQLSKNPAPDIATRNTAQAYQRAHGALTSDMQSFLSNNHPDLADQYKAANNYWAANVSPYRENSQILKVASGDVTNPRNISNLFRNPEPETQKILADLPEQTNYKILYNELGKPQATSKPENLLKTYENLDSKGLGSYVTPELATKMDTLAGRVGRRDFAQRASGALVGALGARMIPGAEAFPIIAEGLGAGLGMSVAPKAMSYLQRAMPQGARGISTRGLRNAYDLSAKAAIANLLPGANY